MHCEITATGTIRSDTRQISSKLLEIISSNELKTIGEIQDRDHKASLIAYEFCQNFLEQQAAPLLLNQSHRLLSLSRLKPTIIKPIEGKILT